MKIKHVTVKLWSKHLTALFRYVIENLLGISTNSIAKSQALVMLILARNLVLKCLKVKHFSFNLWMRILNTAIFILYCKTLGMSANSKPKGQALTRLILVWDLVCPKASILLLTFESESLAGLFWYDIENLWSISANSIPRGQDLKNGSNQKLFQHLHHLGFQGNQ